MGQNSDYQQKLYSSALMPPPTSSPVLDTAKLNRSVTRWNKFFQLQSETAAMKSLSLQTPSTTHEELLSPVLQQIVVEKVKHLLLLWWYFH